MTMRVVLAMRGRESGLRGGAADAARWRADARGDGSTMLANAAERAGNPCRERPCCGVAGRPARHGGLASPRCAGRKLGCRRCVARPSPAHDRGSLATPLTAATVRPVLAIALHRTAVSHHLGQLGDADAASATGDSSPCVEGNAFDAYEGGEPAPDLIRGWIATDLARHLRQWANADKRAKSDGVPGGGEACRAAAQTPPP